MNTTSRRHFLQTASGAAVAAGLLQSKPTAPLKLSVFSKHLQWLGWEAMAQTAAILSFLTMGKKPDENTIVYFVGIDGVRFKRPVGPGDQLKMEVEILRVSRGIWKYKAKATVDGQLAVEAELMCTLRSADDAAAAPATALTETATVG